MKLIILKIDSKNGVLIDNELIYLIIIFLFQYGKITKRSR